MHRLQIQLDDQLYDAIRQRAFERRVSMASVVREAIVRTVEVPRPRPRTLSDFRFIGAGSSEPPADGPVSENHDTAFAEAALERFQKA